ncbi:MAG: DNA polymerase III subunit alpha, partial [Parcubacteria group bacterium Greene1014_15]
MVALAKKYGMPAIGLTDHGNMYGAIEFYKECKAAKIKPIIGVEAYIANRTRFDKEPSIDNKRYHLTLLAKNKTGYENLIKLVTASHLEGYYYKPRMDLDVLKTHSEGLICLSGCFGSELSHALRNKNEKEAIHVAETYRDIFGEENYFFEIMHHPGVPGLMDVRAATVELGKKLAIPLVATADSHYLHEDDGRAHETLLAIQTNSDMNDENRFSMASDRFAFITTEIAYDYFKDTPEAVENTSKIADMCDITLELGSWVFPDLKIGKETTYDEELR